MPCSAWCAGEMGRVSQRAHVILLSAQGWNVPEITSVFFTTPVTVRSLIQRFEAAEIDGLCEQP